MQRESLTDMTIADFQNAIENKKLVILYPQTSHRTLYLSYLLEIYPDTVVYYRLKEDCKTVSDLLSDFADERSMDTLKNVPDDPTKQAQALATALAEHDNSVLYLDELDRLPINDQYRTFFKALVDNLSEHNQLVLNGRSLTTEPWRQFILDDVGVVIGTERRQSRLMFTADSANKPQLEIYAFGRGHAIINGSPVDSWDGALPRHLFFYFIDRDLVTRDEIFKAFWPDLGAKEATNVFHVTKRKISERLSANVYGEDDYELTAYSTGFYRPADKIVRHYDVAEFESAVNEASMEFNDDKQAQLYRRAIDLYRAPFLLTIDMPWVDARREKLQRLLLEALIGLARIHKSANRHEQALGYFMRAIHETPLREDIHREVMMLYRTLGFPDEAIRQYQQLEVLLQDMVGIAPGPETQALLQEISA